MATLSRIGAIDTYNQFISSGFSEEQAMLLLKELDESMDGCVTNNEFKMAFKDMKHDFAILRKDMKWLWRTMMVIGGLCAYPILERIFGF